MRNMLACLIVLSLVFSTGVVSAAEPASSKPNVLFIAIDDLNDWVGCLGGHPQSITPNIDRLAASGVLFTNAHCPAPACNPSRSAIFTGRSPHRSGLYDNLQKMRDVMPNDEIMPKTFTRHGYFSAGSGKMLHYFIDAPSWDEYFPKASTENPFPKTMNPEDRPLSLPRGGPWQYVETDWGPIDATDEDYGGDFLVTKYCAEHLTKSHDKPFFLACGIYRPHEPWFVPQKYFDPFPLESVQLPVGYKKDDLADLPPAGQKRGPNRYFEHIQNQNQWKQGVQGYLASIHYADAMLGRVITALEAGPNANNTIVVLWSDHGWHLGEKQHWQKYTAWRACTRVPLIIKAPAGTPGLPKGTTSATCSQPVNLLSMFPTLLELCQLPAEPHHDGPSLVPLLKNATCDWPHTSVTHLSEPKSFGMSTQSWRYIHYANGDEEMYDTNSDPYEWNNLAADTAHAGKLTELRQLAPSQFASKPKPTLDALTKLKWRPAGDEAVPSSKPDGSKFDVVFINRRKTPVQLYWMNTTGGRKLYTEIAAGEQKRQESRPGAVWMIADENGKRLGHFVVDDRTAKAIVPK